MSAPRPSSIHWFERIAYLSLFLSVVTFNILYRSMQRTMPDVPDGRRGALALLTLATLAFYIPLIILAARRASNTARWLLVILLGLHLLGLANLRAILDYGGPTVPIAFAQYAMSAVLIWLLFRPDARQWFAKGRPVDPDLFR